MPLASEPVQPARQGLLAHPGLAGEQHRGLRARHAVELVAGGIEAPTTLSLLVARIEAPLGLVMLGLQVLVLLVFAVYIATWPGAVR